MATRRRSVKMSAEKRLQEMCNFVNLCFAMFDDMTPAQIAEKTGLSVNTIYRLHSNEITLATHFGTIQAMGLAAGLRLEMTEGKPARVRLAA